ncbi:hypothetical protein EC9_27520 [Rosistilla ulvae]|uniref:DUF1579 domain-containing protein n=1 Tax=Rosistilla ulvae TaxID=1930277 RepID=A0A517M104_9BACT|nr:DUF1579 domain-containing protein [Rosistilla ulvae]QDS88561.1 hypothetical protein EC9_27520 [Rosistilla ulvae]
MFAKPQQEHLWLDRLVGNWAFEHHCEMPDGTKSATEGKMVCRSLSGMWLICESSGISDDGQPWSSIMTLGFDVKQNRYVGSFIGSMMSNLWLYQGDLDDAGKRLPLQSIGPTFAGTGTCKYRDTIEIIDADNWLFTSELQNEAGEWVKFMDGPHRRA